MSSQNNIIVFKSIPLYYKTYNTQYVFLSAILMVMFVFGFFILYTILQYELFNRQAYCDPRYYYGRACTDLTTESILKDPTFLKKKKSYYDSLTKSDEIVKKDGLEIGSDYKTINEENGLSNPIFIEESAKKVNSMVDKLTTIKSSYLGNPDRNLIQSIDLLNNSFLTELQDLPKKLSQIQDMFTDGVILPSTTHLIDALKKLYKSVNDPVWTVSPTSGPTPGSSV